MAGRTLIVGDVHGCFEELLDLLRACRYAPEDEVVLVGDLVAKGPRSVDVVHWARTQGARAVLGNHDAHVLSVLDGTATKPRPQHEEIAAALSPQDVDYLRALPLWLDLPGHDIRVVHGGMVPGLAPEAQSREHLLTMRSVDADGVYSSRDGGAPWASTWAGPPFIVFGHHASAGLQQHPEALGLDTGCVYGRHLSALLLPYRRVVSVPAREAYVPTYGPGRTYAGPEDTLDAEPRVVPLGPGPDGRPREALVLQAPGAGPRAYLNRCAHVPIPLDGGGRRFLDDDRRHLVCGTHGAIYRLDDGFCVAGPCSGESLEPLPLQQAGGFLWLLDPPVAQD